METYDCTGLVLTYNGERLLEDCLRSLSFCRELLVVDSESSDNTRAIAEACGAKVLVRKWEGPVPQFEYAFEHITTEWLVMLDQDESLSPELSASIQAVLANPPEGIAGYHCPRRSFYFDRFLKHCGWYPDYLLRFGRMGKIEVSASGPHYSMHPKGEVKKLKGDIIHYPYRDLREHFDKINYYTQEAAQDLHAKGKKSGLIKALAHGIGRFCKVYIIRRGFLDGRAGLILAIHAFMYAFNKYIRVAELARRDKAK